MALVSTEDSGRLTAQRFERVKQLGVGAFGAAWLVTDREDAAIPNKVLKQVFIGKLDPNETADAVKEAQLLSRMKHPNIISFHGAFISDAYVCIIMEYCEGGDLDGRIVQCRERNGRLDARLILDWLVQLAMALQYIHEKRVLHRDLKTKNIFLKNNMVKLGDFGIAKTLMNTQEVANTFAGTPYYMSPEVLQNAGYNAKSDIWALGCVLYEMCCLEQAFKSEGLLGLLYKICEGDPPSLPDRFDLELRNLFRSLMAKKPSDRPDARQILENPYIKAHMLSMQTSLNGRQVNQHGSLVGQSALSKSSVNGKRNSKLAKDLDDLNAAVAKLADSLPKLATPTHPVQSPESPSTTLTPQQRMALKKQQEADRRAQELKRIAAENAQANIQRYSADRARLHTPSGDFPMPHTPYNRRDNTSTSSLSPLLPPQPAPTSPLSPKTASIDEFTIMESVNMPRAPSPLQMTIPDESHQATLIDILPPLPINKANAQLESLYIPEDAASADAYYSALDEFETLSSDSEDDGDDEDMMQLQACLREAIDWKQVPGHEPEKPISPQESMDNAPIRLQRIEQLKIQAQRQLGEKFAPVYEFLRQARQSRMSESAIVNKLRMLVPSYQDCFLVDQLVWMELYP